MRWRDIQPGDILYSNVTLYGYLVVSVGEVFFSTFASPLDSRQFLDSWVRHDTEFSDAYTVIRSGKVINNEW